MKKSGDDGFLHKRQLARRLRGFSFHFSLSNDTPWAHFRKSDTQYCQSAITSKIKIKYVMQILKERTGDRTAFVLQMEKVYVIL